MSSPVANSPRISTRLPRPLWFGLAAVVVSTAYAGLCWHNLRTMFGDVSLPLFVVVPSDFDSAREAGRHEPISTTIGLVTDEAMFVRFLDEAYDKWAMSR
jgi:hypothetical protein